MRIITIARKPLSERTVSSNVLKHGCGSINIDGTRIATPDGNPHFENRPQGVSLQSSWIDQSGMFSENRRGTLSSASSLGRWPANLILIHKAGCECVGTKKIVSNDRPRQEGKLSEKDNIGWIGKTKRTKKGLTRHGTSDGKETVEDWNCAEGCPAREMGEQSGILKSGAMDSIAKSDQYSTYGKMYERRVVNPASEGTAARFFKHIKSS